MKLFIAIPCYQDAPANFVQCLAALISQPVGPAKISIKQGDSLITRARNQLTADFLESDCTHLLWIDSDLLFTRDDVARIASHDLPIVGGMYPLRREGPDIEWCGNGLLRPSPPLASGLQEVRYIGTGFCCIQRAVFERMQLADPAIAYTNDAEPHRPEWDFWRVGVHPTADSRRRYLSEDWFFCQRWLDLGGHVWADTKVILRHIGPATWPLPHQWANLNKPEA